MNELILHCDTATEGCVSNDFFRHSLDDSPGTYLTYLPSPSLNTVELIVIHNCPCEHSSKLQLSIRFSPSRCLDVRQDWYPMYYPEEMKARVSPVQSIEPHRILAPTRDLNREPLGPQSRVVTTTLPLQTPRCWLSLSNVNNCNRGGCYSWASQSNKINRPAELNCTNIYTVHQACPPASNNRVRMRSMAEALRYRVKQFNWSEGSRI